MLEKSAAQILTLAKVDAMFFLCLRMMNARFWARCCVYMCKKVALCPRRDLALSGTQGILAAAAK